MRWVAGSLLVVAAALKAVPLVTDPTAALLNPLGPYFLSVEIGVELGLGLLLLSGLYWRTLRWLVIAVFTTFAGYSFYLAMDGAASCGCFGSLHVNPWWAFGLDLVVVSGLLVSALFEHQAERYEFRSGNARLRTLFNSRHQAIAVIVSIGVISAAALFRYAGQRTVLASGVLASGENLVVLEPEEWIGQKLPIADSIDLDLSGGEWVVLLYRHDCPLCQAEVPKYEKRAASGKRIALVEVPPYGDFGIREMACHYGRLKQDHEWLVQTPVEVQLHDGIVTSAKTHEH